MCCLFGLIDYNNTLSVRKKERIIRVLSKECEDRGTDATGVAYITDDRMHIFKRPLPAHRMKFKFKGNPSVIMGHTRMKTQGSELYNENNHPFYSKKLGFALAHNGVLYNDTTLRKSEKLPKTKIETDSYIAVQLIEKQRTLDFESLKYMAEKIEGSFCFTVLSKNNELYIVKGDNPMAIAEFNGFYIYASTSAILEKALKRLNMKKYKKVEIMEGDIFRFNIDGSITKDIFNMQNIYSYYPYWGYSRKSKKYSSIYDENDAENNAYIDDLINYARYLGVDKDIISSLIASGYSYAEIEDLLYNAEFYTDEIEEDDFCAEI